jgi:hypothetical protein
MLITWLDYKIFPRTFVCDACAFAADTVLLLKFRPLLKRRNFTGISLISNESYKKFT